jgi:hypothetical protein
VEGCLVDVHFVRHLGRRTPVKLSRCGKGELSVDAVMVAIAARSRLYAAWS